MESVDRSWNPIVPCGAGSKIYDPQPIEDRLVGRVGDFHTLRGDISSGDIHPCLIPLYMCGLIMILRWDPIVLR